MAYSFLIYCLYITSINVLNHVEFSNSQGVDLLQENMNWENANNSCNLAKEIVDVSVLQQGQRAWTGKRTMFTDWMVLEDCINYVLDDTLSTTVQINGESSVAECYNTCRVLFQTSSNQRFGLQKDGSDRCVCDNPGVAPNFGVNDGKCTVIECQSNVAEDLCGNRGFLVYNSYPPANIKGSEECGAFIRTGKDSFQSLALPCSERLGNLRDIASHTYSINRTISTWREKVFSEGVGPGYPRLSNRVRPHTTVWRNIPLNEWPVNVSLWLAVTRRKMNLEKQDPTPCYADKCFCVAIHRDDTSLQEELIDCNTELPSLCVRGTITTVPTTITTTPSTTTASVTSPSTPTTSTTGSQTPKMTTTNVTMAPVSETKTGETTRTAANGLFVPIAVSVTVAILVVSIIAVIILVKRRRRNRGKRESTDLRTTTQEYVNTTLEGEDSTPEAPYVTATVPSAEHNYEPIQKSSYQYESIEQQQSTDHTYLSLTERTPYEETQVAGVEHVYSSLK